MTWISGTAMSKNTPTDVLDELARQELRENYARWKRVIEFLAPDYPTIIGAIVQVESSWNPAAYRHEPRFYDRYVATNRDWQDRINEHGWQALKVATSWGLMQILFCTAWERGYRGDPEGLLVPEVSLLYGTMHFQHLTKSHGYSVEDAIAAYNAGTPARTETGEYRNQKYVSNVLATNNALTMDGS